MKCEYPDDYEHVDKLLNEEGSLVHFEQSVEIHAN